MEKAPARFDWLGSRGSILQESIPCRRTEATAEAAVDTAPTERRGDVLPADHPAASLAAEAEDCISHIPADVKDATAMSHGNSEPPDTPPDPEELV